MPISTGALYDFILTLRGLRGSNAKKEAIRNFRKTSEGKHTLDWLYNAAYDYTKMFGVVSLKFKDAPIYTDDDTFIEDIESKLLNPLLNNEFNKPRLEASAIASQFNLKTRELIKLILKKDLKTGLLDKVYNDVVGYEVCPQFNVQLASSGGKTFEAMLVPIIKLLNKKHTVLMSGKYDGIRVIGYPDGRLCTRNGHDISKNYPEISDTLKQLSALRHKNKQPDIILDGELYDPEGKASNTVMTQAFRKESVETVQFKYMIFDCLLLNDWEDIKCSMPIKDRLHMLDTLESVYTHMFKDKGFFRIVPHVEVTTEQEIRDAFQIYKSEGLEGIMIKDPDSFYNYKRDKTWYKLKTRETATLTIIGFFPGKSDKKYKDTLGALLLSDGGHCGYGLTDKLRDEIWNNKEKFLGVKVDVYYDTRLDTEKGLMRFPSFAGFRWDLMDR